MMGIINTNFRTILVETEYSKEIIDLSVRVEHFNKVMEILRGSCLVKRSGCSTWPASWNEGMYNEEPMELLSEKEKEQEELLLNRLLRNINYK